MKIQCLLVAPLILIALQVEARVNPSNPNGTEFGAEANRVRVPGTDATRCISDEWASDFLGQIEDRLSEADNYQARVAMQSLRLGMENEPEFCQPPMQTDAGTKLFMLAMAEALFVEESSCNPEVVNPHAPNGDAIGFGQMGVEDARNHGCTRAEDGGRIRMLSDLQDARTNSRCVAQIMMNCAAGLPNSSGSMRERRHYGAIAMGTRGQFGAVGCFWQPIRKGTGGDGQGGTVDNQSDRERIMSVTAQFCETAGQGTDALVSNGFVNQDVLCQAMNDGPCRTNMASPGNTPSTGRSRTTTL